MRFPSERMAGIEKTLIRRVFEQADPSGLNLGLGELAFPTPRAILDGLSRDIGTWPLGYTANAGLSELRKLIAARTGPGLGAENVCVTIGAEEAIFALLMILVNPGDEVLVPDPGFPAYATIVRMAGGSAVPYPLRPEDRFAINARAVAPRITPRTRLIIVNSPHNPTGAVASDAELRDLADLCRKHDLTAISDEVYREIVYDGPAASLSTRYDRTIVVDSLSKTYSMTGWRLGWCVGPPELIRLVETFNQLAISCPPAVCQRAALLALGGVADEEKSRNIRELGSRRDLAVRRLEEATGFPLVPPRGAVYLYAAISSRLEAGRTSLAVALDLIKKEKVIVIPGLAFGGETAGFLRISFAAEPAVLEEGIRRLGRYFGRA